MIPRRVLPWFVVLYLLHAESTLFIYRGLHCKLSPMLLLGRYRRNRTIESHYSCVVTAAVRETSLHCVAVTVRCWVAWSTTSVVGVIHGTFVWTTVVPLVRDTC